MFTSFTCQSVSLQSTFVAHHPRKNWERSNQTSAFQNSSSNHVQSLELRKRQALYTEQEVMSKNEIKGQKLHENAAVFHWKT